MQSTFALAYLVQLALSRLLGFFTHWYSDGTKRFIDAYRRVSHVIEDAIAPRAMFHLLFQPLYGDYSVVGRLIGPLFRLGRLSVGLFVYALLIVTLLSFWLLWVAIPPLLIAYATGFFS